VDFFKKLTDRAAQRRIDADEEMLKRYGTRYAEGTGVERGIMRLAAQSEDAEEMDLTPTFRAKVGEPTGANPLDIYRKMYSTYGGRKTRGLLFD
jgi:hypothetical protein